MWSYTLDVLDLRSLCGSCVALVVPPGITMAWGLRCCVWVQCSLGCVALEEAMGQDCSPRRPSICKGRAPPYFHLALPGMAAGRKGSWIHFSSLAWVRSRDW